MAKAGVYIAPDVADVLSLYLYLRDESFRQPLIRHQILKPADPLHVVHRASDPRRRIHVPFQRPAATGKTIEDMLAADVPAEQALQEYAFDGM